DFCIFIFFFFQAEDGIRDLIVTGVQTCALPISTATEVYVGGSFTNAFDDPFSGFTVNRIALWDPVTGWWPLGSGLSGSVSAMQRSEERRVGKECRTRGGRDQRRENE